MSSCGTTLRLGSPTLTGANDPEMSERRQRRGDEVEATTARYLALLLTGLRCMDEDSAVRLGHRYLDRACKAIATAAKSEKPRVGLLSPLKGASYA